MTTTNHTGLPLLSPREEQVLKLLAYGRTDQQIADQLDLSVDTVKTHMGRMNRKWGTSNRVQLVVTAFQYGVLAVPDAPLREAANGATNARLWALIDEIRYMIGLPELELADAETLLTSTASGVRQLVRANYLMSTSKNVRPLGGVARVG